MRLPAGRWGEPSDARWSQPCFFCSGAADYLHGVVLLVDGPALALVLSAGLTAWRCVRIGIDTYSYRSSAWRGTKR